MVAVFTGADMAADGVGGLPCGWQIHNKDGRPMAEPPHPVLAVGKVRHVGDPVAVVIAETRQQAKDAAELLEIDYEELPAVGHHDATRSRPARRRARRVRRQHLLRLAYRRQGRGRCRVRRAPRKVVKLDCINNRLIPNAMEPRAAIGEFDPAPATTRSTPPARTRT